MCQQCDYRGQLEVCGLDPTPRRLQVLEIIGTSTAPLSARQVFETLHQTRPINRVTVYRILDLLVANGLVEKLSAGGRAHVYGPAPSENHPAHPIFSASAATVCNACPPKA